MMTAFHVWFHITFHDGARDICAVRHFLPSVMTAYVPAGRPVNAGYHLHLMPKAATTGLGNPILPLAVFPITISHDMPLHNIPMGCRWIVPMQKEKKKNYSPIFNQSVNQLIKLLSLVLLLQQRFVKLNLCGCVECLITAVPDSKQFLLEWAETKANWFIANLQRVKYLQ